VGCFRRARLEALVTGSSSVLDRIERLLHREHHAILLGHRDLMTLPLEERVERGDTLAGLRFLGEEPGGRIRLACSDNLAKHRPGDSLRLANSDSAEGGWGVGVTYSSFDDATGVLVVHRDPYRADGRFDLSQPLQLDPDAQSLTGLALEALARVRSGSGSGSIVREILEGGVVCTVDAAALRDADALSRAIAPPFDESQHEAFASALSQVPVALIQGPPGTGKTHVLARVVCALAAQGARVVVTAFTHRAVNHALRKIAEADPRLSVIKAGKVSGADDLRGTPVTSAASIRRLPSLDGRPRVVGATVFGLKAAWDADLFDAVVVDEAAQVPLAYASCALLAGRRFVLVGDHRQLGPIVQGRHDDPLATVSVFEHLAVSMPPALLRTTYRMNDGVNAFPSRTFYGGRLSPSAAAAGARFEFLPGGPWDDLFDPAVPAVLALVRHEGHRTRSEPEARLCVALALDRIVRQGGDPADLAIVSPYRAQLRLIRTLLRSGLSAAGYSGRLPVIDTVERIQGQERDLVVVSLVASDPEHLAGDHAAFFYSGNRLNVTLTRARTKLIVVASPLAFEAYPRDLAGLQDVERFRRLRRETPAIELSLRAAMPTASRA
jgi:DNA replication ATP-dependent helicase Dna2